MHTSPGRLSLECTSVDSLIREAYLQFAHGPYWRRVPGVALPIPSVSQGEVSFPIKGSTGWIQSEHFAIDAKASSPAADDVMLGPMMQELLKDRFKLRIHRELADMPVYELVISKTGAKLKPAKAGACRVLTAPPPPRAKGNPIPPPICGGFSRPPNNVGTDMYGVTMSYLSLMLSRPAERDVIDKTGLTGEFDIHFDAQMEELGFAPRAANPPAAPAGGAVGTAPDPGATLNDAIRKLGLTLRPAKKRIEAIVIDHVERPTAN